VGSLDHGDSFCTERREHMLFGREVIKKRSLAYVRGFGDIRNGGLQKTAVRKKLERGLKKAVANFSAPAFSPARPGRRREPAGNGDDGWQMF
jgi:hypothetical protein